MPGKPGAGTQSLSRNATIGVVGEPQTSVAGCRDTPVGRVSRQPCVRALGLGGDRVRVRRPVVDDDHRPAARQRRQAVAQLIAASVHGNHDRQLGASVVGQRRVGIEQPGVEQPSRQQPLIARVADRPAQRPACDEPGAAGREREQPQGRAAEQQLAVAERPQVRGRAQPPTSWDRGPVHPRDKTRVGAIDGAGGRGWSDRPETGQDGSVSAYDERPWLSLYAERPPA